MPVFKLTQGLALNPVELETIARAYKMACSELNLPNSVDPRHDTIAKKIIALFTEGETDPDRLSKLAVQSFAKASEPQTG